MFIRKYGEFPLTYAPDVGEVVLARSSPVEATWHRAVVLDVDRQLDRLRFKVQWLSGPRAQTQEWIKHYHSYRSPVIKQIPRDRAG